MTAGLLLLGCDDGKTTMATPDMAPNMSSDMGGPVIEGEHGRLVDYFSNMPLAGLTVTDGTNSVTTGADGTFVLPAPMGATLSPVASGPMFASLYLPEATADGVDVDRRDVPMATLDNFTLEQSILANDTSMALVHILIRKSGACTSLAGGTITVSSPAGTKIAYFSTSGLPAAQVMYDVVAPKPNAVVYNVAAGASLDVQIDVPGCTQVPFGGSKDGMVLTGKVPTLATEPGDNASALIFDLQ
jgi:hypothetical protein